MLENPERAAPTPCTCVDMSPKLLATSKDGVTLASRRFFYTKAVPVRASSCLLPSLYPSSFNTPVMAAQIAPQRQQILPSPSVMVAPRLADIMEVRPEAMYPVLGGHRGMGANVIRNGSLTPAWRENTLRSFQAAAAHGAAFVEFDVQVTKDGVPVVWHDNTVEYGDPSQPTQCAISDLTSAEFEALGQLSASGKCQQLSVVRRFRHAAAKAAADMPPVLQAALTTDAAVTQRMRWCCEADDSFPTLEQLFNSLPAKLAFNIEVKMATPDDLAVTPADEISRIVRPILDVVSRCNSSVSSAGNSQAVRQVVFSSFDPDVCRALRAAQDQHPVMFLSAGGRDWHADPRRMSIDAAIHEAVASRLSGVVTDSGALRSNPEAATVAKANGLRLLTYGLENDDVDWVMRQQQMGITGVIVDDLQGLVGVLKTVQQDAAGLVGQVAAAAASAAVSAPPTLHMTGGAVAPAVRAS